MPLLPIWSLAVEPTRLLSEDSVPDKPVSVLNVVKAPALLCQDGLLSSTLLPPRKRWILPLPTWSPARLPRRLDNSAPLAPS